MQTSKIKIKIGEHEFHAEGPSKLVQSQFQAFSDLLYPAAAPGPLASSTRAGSSESIQDTDDACPDVLTKVLCIEGRVVWLRASSATLEDAALLLMLGQRDMRNNLSSTGQEIHEGLERSGQLVRRVDRLISALVKAQFVTTNGSGRSMRYRLTSDGVQRARVLARHLASELLPQVHDTTLSGEIHSAVSHAALGRPTLRSSL